MGKVINPPPRILIREKRRDLLQYIRTRHFDYGNENQQRLEADMGIVEDKLHSLSMVWEQYAEQQIDQAIKSFKKENSTKK